MANLIPTKPSGWNDWIYLKGKADDTFFRDAAFPPPYLPSSSLWLKSLASNCLIPWQSPLDPDTIFKNTGGSTPNVGAQAVAIKNVEEVSLALIGKTGEFGLYRNNLGPVLGYNVSDVMKQYVYVYFRVSNIRQGFVVEQNPIPELVENSRLKDVYVRFGDITRYVVEDGKHLLTLSGVSKLSPPTDDMKASLIGRELIIWKGVGNFYTRVKINNVKDNWIFVIDDPGEQKVGVGDIWQWYGFDYIVLEDPYLLAGNYIGAQQGKNSTFYTTNQNKFYDENCMQGIYVWMPIDGNTAGIQPPTGSSMADATVDGVKYEWKFVDFDNFKVASGKAPKKYKEVVGDKDTDNNSSIQYEERGRASVDNYLSLLKSNPTYIRVEINNGDRPPSDNWYAPALEGNYLIWNSELYKVLSHVEANIVDIKFKGSFGRELEPGVDEGTVSVYNTFYSIYQTKGWMIAEDYVRNDNANDNEAEGGVLKGDITSIDGKNIKVMVNGDVAITGRTSGNVTLNLMQRYKKDDLQLDSLEKKFYTKFEGWRLIKGDSEYLIDSVDFGEGAESGNDEWNPDPYVMTVTLKEETSSLAVGDTTYISAGEPFNTFPGYSKEFGNRVNINVTGVKKEESSFYFTDTLCLDGDYTSNPYKVSLQQNSRFGFLRGLYFGLDSDGSAANPYAQWDLITTFTGHIGVSALVHFLRNEGWVFHQDYYTGKLTIRRGSLDFTEYPMKTEVVIGEIQNSSNGSSSVVTLEPFLERTRRLIIPVPGANDGTDIPYLLFSFTTENNIYGSYVSGQGDVNLAALGGECAEDVDSSEWTSSDGVPVSPVYIYKKAQYQHLDNLRVDMGVDASSGPIYIKNGIPNGVVKVEYIKDNQTLEQNTFFDAFQLPDGRILLVYGHPTPAFDVENKGILNNEEENKWDNINSVFIIDTANNDFNWGTPFKKKFEDEKSKYPLMIMNSVDYLTSLYNPFSNELCVIVKSFVTGEGTFYGAYIVSLTGLYDEFDKITDKNFKDGLFGQRGIYEAFLVEGEDDDFFSFYMREPFLHYDGWPPRTHKNLKWSNAGIAISKLPSTATPENVNDTFVRIFGPQSANPQIVYDGTVGIPSLSMLSDGSYVLLYGILGVRAAFSTDSGRKWVTADLIYARERECGFRLGDYLFYIAPEGIKMKKIEPVDWSKSIEIASKKNAGENVENLEVNEQARLDVLKSTLIGSGAIDLQRLSGYITPEGIYKVFYYTTNGLLTCSESTDASTWKIADNF